MTIGQRIKIARTEANMTQEELATKLSIPYQSISQWERNLRNPKRENIQRIAAALGVSIAAFYDFTPEEQKKVARIERILLKAEEQLRIAREENAPDIKNTEEFYETVISSNREMMDQLILLANVRHQAELAAARAEAVLNASTQPKTGPKRVVSESYESKQQTAQALLETTISQLNDEGQQKLLDHMKELSSLLVQIPSYQRKSQDSCPPKRAEGKSE